MSFSIPVEDIRVQPLMTGPPDFHRKSVLMQLDRVYECVIINIVELTEMEKLFHLKIVDPQERRLFHFLPGQFVMLELPGFGEVPISISGSSSITGRIGLCVRTAGRVTGMLHRAAVGTKVGIRGPFGTHFPMERMYGHNILLVAGGLGFAPLRAPLYWISEHRSDYKSVSIMYGTRRPGTLLFDYQYDMWSRVYKFDIHIIVEEPDDAWTGRVGLITDLFADVAIDPQMTYAIVCGPPVMFKHVCRRLNTIGIPMHRMFVSLERRMHCGVGKCCRCMVGSTFTCIDGPVMDFWTVMNLKEAI